VELETRLTLQLREPPLLESDVIGIIEIVNPHNTVTFRQQEFTDFRGDETGSASNENVHLVCSADLVYLVNSVDLVHLVYSVDLVYLVYSVGLVYLVYSVGLIY